MNAKLKLEVIRDVSVLCLGFSVFLLVVLLWFVVWSTSGHLICSYK